MDLVPCSACGRHVKRDNSQQGCPFCGGAVAPAPKSAGAIEGRLGRAARVALGASAIVTLSGCPKENVAQPYGAPPERTIVANDAGADVGPVLDENLAKPYGAPPAFGLMT